MKMLGLETVENMKEMTENWSMLCYMHAFSFFRLAPFLSMRRKEEEINKRLLIL
jgi:hypothetical protein